MKRLLSVSCVLFGVAACAPPPPPAPPPSTAVRDSLRAPYDAVKGYLTKTAEQVAENKLNYQPTKEVRTIGQILGHIADANYMFCATASGEIGPGASAEKMAKTKADLQKALADSFAFCDRAFNKLDDQSGAAEATIAALNMKTTKLGALVFNTAHDNEHYGNLVTYLRLNKMVPPSSQNPMPGM